ncbi:hypothetical protein ACFWAP_00625 [Streptomyces goshikiensis]|uniref:phage tail fiber protein n=1 Tax=Streptomyces goshikiensis TaxID=1942 RepID=UPI00365AC1C2
MSTVRNYFMRLWQQQGMDGLSSFLPVAFLSDFATQAKADTSGSWLTALINSRTDVAGTCYLTMLTSDPGRTANLATMAAVEVKATGYSRQPVSFSSATSAPGGGSGASNSVPAYFGPFTSSGGMGTVATHAGLVTVPTGTTGAVLAVWQLDAPVTAGRNENITLSTGGLGVGLDSWQS